MRTRRVDFSTLTVPGPPTRFYDDVEPHVALTKSGIVIDILIFRSLTVAVALPKQTK
jgi:hypothetical protein